MFKCINLFFIVSTVFLMGQEDIYIEDKIVVKMINKSEIQFISAEKSKELIIGSKLIDVSKLFSSNILGYMECKPLYSCPNKIEEYLSKQGILKNQSLILYDNSYGIYASTLYIVLESIGHKNIAILNGGLESILKIDPNQKLYTKYEDELEKISALKKNDNNSSSEKSLKSKVTELKDKLKVLKPHLLITTLKESNISNSSESSYIVDVVNSNYLLSKDALEQAAKTLKEESESNITIIDVCPMVDIVGNNKGSYIAGVIPISWKELIDKKERRLKSTKLLTDLFNRYNLKKENENYLYCMSGSPKAFFMMTAMRHVGYKKVKAFSGDWNVWIGDIDE